MTQKPGHITLNFSPYFLERVRSYARAHRMKVNAVLKMAFELLEDQPKRKEPEYPDDYP